MATMTNQASPITLDPEAKRLALAIRQQESNNNYNAKGASGEHGAYQFMPDTWKGAAKDILGDANAPMTPENQNKVAYTRIKQWKDEGYRPDQIASKWNHGSPDYKGVVGDRIVNGKKVHYDTPAYVRKVQSIYERMKRDDKLANPQTPAEQRAAAAGAPPGAAPVASGGGAGGPAPVQKTFSQNHPVLGAIGGLLGSGLENIGKGLGNLAAGSAKGVMDIPREAAALGTTAGGLMGKLPGADKAGEAIRATLGRVVSPQQAQGLLNAQNASTEQGALTKPVGTAQNIGYGAEKIGELFVPGLGEEAVGADVASAGEKAPLLARAIQAGKNAVTKGTLSGADLAARTAVQTNDPKQAVLAGAFGLAGGVGGEIAGKVGEAVAPALKESAVKGYIKALAPTTIENKAIAKKIAPGLLERGVTGITRGSLMAKLGSGVEGAIEGMNKVLEKIPEKTPVNIKNIVSSLEKVKEDFMIMGEKGKMIAADPEAVQHIEMFQKILNQVGTETAPVETVRKLRQIWDKAVQSKKGFFGKTVAEGTKLDIQREAAGAIREELAKQFPDLDKANKEFHFWMNAQKVLGDTMQRTAGHAAPLGQTIAEAAGTAGALAEHSGIPGAVFMGQVFKGLKALVSGTGWKTVGAVTKNRIANLLAEGKGEEALAAITKLTVGLSNRK